MHYSWIVGDKITFNLMYSTCVYPYKYQRYVFLKMCTKFKVFAFYTKLE